MVPVFVLLSLGLSTTVLAMQPATPPASKREPVTDVYHRVKVVDAYRWLEDFERDDVRRWSQAQNKHARDFLKRLPNRDAIGARVQEVLADESASYGAVTPAGGRIFAMKRQPPKQQPFLIVLQSHDDVDAARILVDPEQIDEEGTTRIDWFVPSPDGKLVAVSLSRKGTESGDVHIFRTEDGERVHEIIPRVNGGTAGGDLAWLPDSLGFFYTRYPRGNERPPEDRDFFQQVYLHRLGEPTEKDRYELGRGLPRIAEIQLDADQRTDRVLATVQDGDGGEFAHFLAGRGWTLAAVQRVWRPRCAGGVRRTGRTVSCLAKGCAARKAAANLHDRPRCCAGQGDHSRRQGHDR